MHYRYEYNKKYREQNKERLAENSRLRRLRIKSDIEDEKNLPEDVDKLFHKVKYLLYKDDAK